MKKNSLFGGKTITSHNVLYIENRFCTYPYIISIYPFHLYTHTFSSLQPHFVFTTSRLCHNYTQTLSSLRMQGSSEILCLFWIPAYAGMTKKRQKWKKVGEEKGKKVGIKSRENNKRKSCHRYKHTFHNYSKTFHRYTPHLSSLRMQGSSDIL